MHATSGARPAGNKPTTVAAAAPVERAPFCAPLSGRDAQRVSQAEKVSRLRVENLKAHVGSSPTRAISTVRPFRQIRLVFHTFQSSLAHSSVPRERHLGA